MFSSSSLPQLVMLTFDDAVSVANYKYTEEIMLGRTNPDGCSAAATFFVSHEYTDYSKVHALWSEGHEIALHSIRYVHTSCSSSFLMLSRGIPVCIGLEIPLGNATASLDFNCISLLLFGHVLVQPRPDCELLEDGLRGSVDARVQRRT